MEQSKITEFIDFVDNEGNKTRAEVVLCFCIEEKKYVVYTFNETDANGMIILYSSLVEMENGKEKFCKINPEDWQIVKEVMSKIVKEGRE